MTAGIFLALVFISGVLYAQDTERRTIPTILLRPQRGESPRYPVDIVIGELGRGTASEDAYSYATGVLTALNQGRFDAPVLSGAGHFKLESLFKEIDSLGRSRSFRIGGGRTEADGSSSFLVRFIGTEESLTGELFVFFNGSWILDDLIFDEKRSLTEIRNNYRFDFSPYERFF